jgi:hypothetical protein
VASLDPVRRTATTWFLVGGACALAAVIVWRVGLRTVDGASLDARVLDGFRGLARIRTTEVASSVMQVADPLPFAVIGVLLLVVGVVSGRSLAAAAGAVVFVGSNVTSQVLQRVTETPRVSAWLPEALWPSGHATAVTSLVVCLVLVAAPAWRSVACAVGTAIAIAVAYSILVVRTHYASDVLGAMLIVGAWTATAFGAIALRGPELPGRRPPLVRSVGPAVAVTAVLPPAVALTYGRLGWSATYVADHHAFMAGAAAIALCALLIVSATAFGAALTDHATRGAASPGAPPSAPAAPRAPR